MKIAARNLDTAAPLPEADNMQRCAYNGAFWDLGFKWQWDAETYRELGRLPDEKTRIRAYLERHQSHLFKAYDADFLVDLIQDHKTRRYLAILAARAAGKPAALSCNALKTAG